MLRGFLLVVAAGCSSTAVKQAPATTPVPPAVAVDPSCVESGVVPALRDGHLRCSELPLDVTFPVDTTLRRLDSGATTVFNATLDKGILAVIVQPAIVPLTPDEIGARMAALIAGMVADATTKAIEAAPLAEATQVSALSFATADGGIGVARGYLVHDWLVVVVAGGRLPTTAARPDQPAGQKFLASLAFHAPQLRPFAVKPDAGPQLELPSGGWRVAGELEPNERIYALPGERVYADLRFFERTDDCDKLKALADGDLAAAMTSIVHDTVTNLVAERSGFGDVGVYFQGDDPRSPGARIVAHLTCKGKWMSVISVAGPRPYSEMRPIADHIARSLR